MDGEYRILGKKVEDVIVIQNNVVRKTTPYLSYMRGWGLPRLLQYLLNNNLKAENVCKEMLNRPEIDC
jgi:hypothetical protein